MTRPVRTVLIAPLLLALTACASLVKEPQVALASVELAGIGIQGATVRVEMDVTNPNGFDLDARAVEYTLFFLPADAPAESDDWRTLVGGRTAQAVTLPRNGTVRVPVEIPFTYREVGDAAASLLRDGTLRYRFQGAFTVGSPVGDLRIPFDRTGLLDP
ncbi:MAG TPA: LEA type 2 family protein [Longimicrobiales bacterium]|nr:LEA type 2 family protein [Longimicrobiales bacterium]